MVLKKELEKTIKDRKKYYHAAYLKCVDSSALKISLPMTVFYGEKKLKKTSEEKFNRVFHSTKDSSESLFSFIKTYCRGVLALENIDWKVETKNHEQKVIAKAINILSYKKEYIYGIDLSLLKKNMKEMRELRNFFIHYEDDTSKKREFKYEIDKNKNIILIFSEENLTKENKSFTKKINSDEFLYILWQIQSAFNLLIERYNLFHRKLVK